MDTLSKPRPRFKFRYAVKFICTSNLPGTSQTSDSVLPGRYQTAVNIHNPNKNITYFKAKLTQPNQCSKYIKEKLKHCDMVRYTCSSIKKFDIVTIHGFEGFLIIESTRRLDVTAVYTAAGINSDVSSIDVEQIIERKI